VRWATAYRSPGEVEKCAWNCDHYADNGEDYLHDEPKASSAAQSYVAYLPIGPGSP